MKFIPHDYQRVARDWIIENPKCGLFLDMGLGKTVTSLTAVEILINDYFDVGKTLVIAPKRVAEETWPTESEKWDHLKNLKVSPIVGTLKQRKKALEKEADIYVISRDNIVWLIDLLKDKWDFDTLIIDELSSFKNHASKRFKKLKTVTPFFKRVIGLTGTPAPNSYLDLWSQIYLLDRGERLGKNITAYRRHFFDSFNHGMYNEYRLKKGAKEEIDKLISDICISMKAKDYLKDLKDPVLVDIKVRLNQNEMKEYKVMAKDAVMEFGDTQIAALNAAAVTNKLLQLANGAIYDESQKFHLVHNRKLDILDELVEEAQGENMLIFYNFKSDYERIKEKYPDAVKLDTDKDIKKWNEGKIKMLLAHPAGAGHGLNLQDGGSIIVWFGLTWSLELYQQANARLQRQGQKNVVRIYRILAENTVDEKVAEVLSGKNMRQEELLQSLKASIV
ncbi:SNF2-related protein [Peptoniphilus asaccharolyticus]